MNPFQVAGVRHVGPAGDDGPGVRPRQEALGAATPKEIQEIVAAALH